MNDFPISRAKVTPPPVRAETLARERLLSWLDGAVLRKIVFVVAEAGYGKTTLLADFSRRTRVRCLWFKLDEQDRDWRTFLHYVVAAGRESLPDFGRATSSLLAQHEGGDPVREAAIQSFASELEQLSDRATAFILDDYHLVEGDPEIARVIQRMIGALPDRMSLVLLSRRRPTLRIARLQAQDEVRELGRDELRFSREETDRLFAESYQQPLEPDVLDEIDSRTEGWIASLQLLHSGLRGRDPADVRAFVRRMAGTQGSLYDYLAEEVVGEMPAGLRRFLVRTSVLDRVTPDLARAALATEGAGGPGLHEVRTLIQQAENAGLLTRRGEASRWSHRYHPLIRDYLIGRLADELGADEIRTLHRQIAQVAESTSWAVAAHHWLEAGDKSQVVATIEREIPAIASSGRYSLAADFLTRAGVAAPNEIASIIQARLDLFAGRVEKVSEFLRESVQHADRHTTLGLQLLMSIAHSLGDVEVAAGVARLLLTRPDILEWQTPIALAVVAIRDVALTAHLDRALEPLLDAALVHERERRWHLAAVSRLNLADLRRVAGDYSAAIIDARRAVSFFRRSGGDAAELSSAYGVLGACLAAMDSLEEAGSAFDDADVSVGSPVYRLEIALLRADFLADSGRLDEALRIARGAIATAGPSLAPSALALAATTGADVATKAYAFELAREWLGLFDASTPATETAGLAHQLLSRARLALLQGGEDPAPIAAEAWDLARRQGARHIAWRASLVASAANGSEGAISSALIETAAASPSALRSEAGVICLRLDRLEAIPAALDHSLRRFPEAWRPHLRRRLSDPQPSVRRANALLLEEHGEWSDVPRLRSLARDQGLRGIKRLGHALARRTAPRVFVNDLGRTTVHIGDQVIEATAMRRKVAALVLYLLTRPGFAATREQVLEAIWPEASPEVGANSLHQTIYFLRRELEPGFSGSVSPGYARLQGELVWLDPELVDSASHRFGQLISRAQLDATNDAELKAITLYRGRFAPEFEYDEWAMPTRESLHAAYLAVVGQAIRRLVTSGAWLDAAEVAREALTVDPDADDVERNLIAIYHRSGAHAAAAEQYEHYAAAQRAELGVEPPSLAAVVTSPDQP